MDSGDCLVSADEACVDPLSACVDPDCPELEVLARCVPTATPDVSSLVRRTNAEPRLTKLQLVATDAACGQRVRAVLVAAGVAASRVEVVVAPGHDTVTARAGVWDGGRCAMHEGARLISP